MSRIDSPIIEAVADTLEDTDAAAADAIDPYSETAPVRLIAWLSEAGDQPPMRTLCAAVIAAGLAGGFPRLTRAGLRMIAAHTLATEAKDFIKLRVDRTRPRSRNGGDGHRFAAGHNPAKEETSFPSGHAAGAAAVALAYAREFPEHRTAALAAAGAVALAQIPRCAHYLTDVGAGLAIGFASEALVDRLADPLVSSEDRPGEADPPEARLCSLDAEIIVVDEEKLRG